MQMALVTSQHQQAQPTYVFVSLDQPPLSAAQWGQLYTHEYKINPSHKDTWFSSDKFVESTI